MKKSKVRIMNTSKRMISVYYAHPANVLPGFARQKLRFPRSTASERCEARCAKIGRLDTTPKDLEIQLWPEIPPQHYHTRQETKCPPEEHSRNGRLSFCCCF